MICSDCTTTDKALCAECNTRAQAAADIQYDRLREEGYRSPRQKYIVEEMEERYLYPFGHQ